MTISKSRRRHKAVAAVLMATLGLMGIPNEAPAAQFSTGDLILAIFGNDKEFYYDLGTKTSLLTPGPSQIINIGGLSGLPFDPGSGVVGGPQTQWTIIGRAPVAATPAANGIFVYAGSQNDAANISIVPAISQTNSRIVGWNSALLSSTGPTPAGTGAQVFLNSTDPAAFTNSNNFGLSGTLGGSWNAGGMQGSLGLGNLLNIIEGRARNEAGLTNVISDAGRAVLSADGKLEICGGAGCNLTLQPVPIPAAVVLFGSGLIGLIGLARRRRAGIPA